MSYYIDDTYISNRFFEGDTVPSDDTIDSATNTKLKARLTKVLNAAMRRTTNATDTYGILEEMGGDLYQLGKDNKPMCLTKEQIWDLQDHGYIEVPFAINNPTQYNLNENT